MNNVLNEEEDTKESRILSTQVALANLGLSNFQPKGDNDLAKINFTLQHLISNNIMFKNAFEKNDVQDNGLLLSYKQELQPVMKVIFTQFLNVLKSAGYITNIPNVQYKDNTIYVK